MTAHSPYDPPIVTVDVVLLTLKDTQLHTALALRNSEPYSGQWALPGGWVHTDEDQDGLDAAARILKEKAGLVSPYLEQLSAFTGKHRDPRKWSVSITYYALIPFDAVGHVSHPNLKWVPIDSVRSLPFDHLQILQTAVSRVRSKTSYSSLPVHLLSEPFTLGELQSVYEVLLGTALDKRSFRRRIEELGAVAEVVGAMTAGQAHRPAQLYQVKRGSGRGLATAGSNRGLKQLPKNLPKPAHLP